MKYKLNDKVRTQNMDGQYNNVRGTIIEVHSNLDIESVYTISYDIPFGSNTKGMFKESDLKLSEIKTYAIRIEEVLAKTVLIDAEDLDSAIERVSELYSNGEIEVEDMDGSDIIPSPYADENRLFLGSEEDKRCYEVVELMKI